MTTTLSIPAVLDRLESGPWRVTGLATMSAEGLYLIHHDGAFFWASLDRSGQSATDCLIMDREAAHAFLARTTPPAGFPSALLSPWKADATPAPEVLRTALSRTQALLSGMRAEPGRALRIMGDWWVWLSPWFGQVMAVVREGSPPSSFCSSDRRAASEVLSALLKEPGLDFEAPPGEIVAFRDDFQARAAAHFEVHGPEVGRIAWLDPKGEERRGFTRDAGGFLIEVGVRGGEEAPSLSFARKTPTDKACERLFRAFNSGSLHGSLTAPPDLARALAGVGEVDTLAAWLSRGAVVVGCGEFNATSWISDSPTTMLDTFKGGSRPMKEVISPFIQGEGWVEIRFETLVTLSDQARASDDPGSPSVRYTIPQGWARRFERERLIEAALVATFRAATGHAAALPRREERDPRADDHREPSIRVHLGDESLGLTLTLDPIESGHGVHGEYVSAVFHGLPPGLGISAFGRLDMRSGGELRLNFTASPEVAMHLKRACLEALP